MVGWYLISRQYKPGTSLGKHGDRILKPVEIKSQDTTFGLGFKPTRRITRSWSPKGGKGDEPELLGKSRKQSWRSHLYQKPSRTAFAKHNLLSRWLRGLSQRLQAWVLNFPFTSRWLTRRRISRIHLRYAGWGLRHRKGFFVSTSITPSDQQSFYPKMGANTNHGPSIAYPIRVRPFLCVSFFIWVLVSKVGVLVLSYLKWMNEWMFLFHVLITICLFSW